MTKMNKIGVGDIVKLNKSIIVGHKYNGLPLTLEDMFDNELEVVWANNTGLIKLSNVKYYTDKMLVKVQ